ATWDRWLDRAHLLAIADLGRPAELAIGYAVYVLWLYWTHRARHAFGPLWRWLHQLHHSPARIEILTSFYKHPLEIVGESILTAALLYIVLGMSREGAFIITNASGVLGLFYHWNISTPRWRRSILQPPAGHRVQHQRGGHRLNYFVAASSHTPVRAVPHPARIRRV